MCWYVGGVFATCTSIFIITSFQMSMSAHKTPTSVVWEHAVIMEMATFMNVVVKVEQCSQELMLMVASHALVGRWS